MTSSSECSVVLAFHDHGEIPYDRWFDDRQFIYIAHAGNAESFRGCRATVHVLADYADTGELFALVDRLGRHHTITHICARAERDVIRAGVLRMRLGIAGLDVDEVCAFRDKHLMYERASAGGVPVAPYARVTSHAQALEFIARHGRSVVKPSFGSGSIGVKVVDGARDLHEVFREFGSEELLIQQFCRGEMHHLDGLWDGTAVHHLTASRYINTCISFQEGAFLGSAIEAISADGLDHAHVARRVLGSLKVVKPLVFHLEIFVDGPRWTFCEVACRPGGVRVVKSAEIATGINLDRALYAAELSLPKPSLEGGLSPVFQPAGWLVIPPRRGRVKAIDVPRGHDWIAELRESPSLYGLNDAARKSGDYLLTYIVTGEDTGTVRQRIDMLGRRIVESMVMEQD